MIILGFGMLVIGPSYAAVRALKNDNKWLALVWSNCASFAFVFFIASIIIAAM